MSNLSFYSREIERALNAAKREKTRLATKRAEVEFQARNLENAVRAVNDLIDQAIKADGESERLTAYRADLAEVRHE